MVASRLLGARKIGCVRKVSSARSGSSTISQPVKNMLKSRKQLPVQTQISYPTKLVYWIR